MELLPDGNAQRSRVPAPTAQAHHPVRCLSQSRAHFSKEFDLPHSSDRGIGLDGAPGSGRRTHSPDAAHPLLLLSRNKVRQFGVYLRKSVHERKSFRNMHIRRLPCGRGLTENLLCRYGGLFSGPLHKMPSANLILATDNTGNGFGVSEMLLG